MRYSCYYTEEDKYTSTDHGVLKKNEIKSSEKKRETIYYYFFFFSNCGEMDESTEENRRSTRESKHRLFPTLIFILYLLFSFIHTKCRNQ